MQDMTPPVLVPENCQSSFGLPTSTNNSECIICGTDLSASRDSVITHPDCRTSFCASCLLQWHHSCAKATCPTCRGQLGTSLTAPGHDPENKEFYLVSGGINELRQMVGDDLFLRAPRIERFVRQRLLAHICGEIDSTNVHLAMANQPKVLDKFLNRTSPYSPIASLERAAFIAARRTLRDWIFTEGITRAQEYCFLDGDGDVRYYVPISPKVRVFASKDELADHISARERFVSRKELIGNGLWLKTISGSKLKKMVYSKDITSLAILKSANVDELARCYPATWALYSPADSMDNTIFACPLKVFWVPYTADWGTQGKPRLLRTFTTRHNTPRLLPEPDGLDLHEIPARHCALHDYEDEFPPVDDTGISMMVPPEALGDAKQT